MASRSNLHSCQDGLQWAALSDVGKVRQNNEDAFALLPEHGLFIVSDGMGGCRAGETASKIVVEALPRMIERRLAAIQSERADVVSLALRDAIVDLSQQLRRQSAGNPDLAGMGATVALACMRKDRLFIAHMGDSRAYLYRGGKLDQLTEDHSVVGILLRGGEITPEEVEVHPARGVLSRYVGMEGMVYPDTRALELLAGDRLLLCTDGLTGMAPDSRIAEILGACDDPQEACQALVEAANASRGNDNVTALVVAFENITSCEGAA
ncbi:MAG: PP2C family protein-serine/threonine phosphatase [Blastocatellia bacterium]